MQCPYCQAENLEKLSNCYNCGQDLSMLRLVVNKARHHYNLGLEHAERQRYDAAVIELKNCLELDAGFISAYVVLGTVYAKQEEYEKAQEMWREALSRDPAINKAHNYLSKVDTARELKPFLHRLKQLTAVFATLCVVAVIVILFSFRTEAQYRDFRQAVQLIQEEKTDEAVELLQTIESTRRHPELDSLAALLSAYLQGGQGNESFQQALGQIRNGQLAEALDALQEIAANSTHPDLVAHSELLTNFIHERLQGNLDLLERQVANREYAAALDTIEQMGNGNFPSVVAEQAQATYERLIRYKEEDLELMLSSMENGLVTSNTVRQELESYGSMFAGRIDEEFHAEVAFRLEAMDVAKKIDAIQQAYLISQDAETALIELELLIGNYEERRVAFADWVEELSQDLANQRTAAFSDAIAKRQLDRAVELLEMRETWMHYLPADQQMEITDNWQSLIHQLESVLLIEEMEGLTFRQLTRLEELAAIFASEQKSQLSPEQRAMAEQIVGQLREKFAEEILNDWMGQDYPLQRAKTSEEYARFILEHEAFVNDHLKALTARYAGDKLLFYSGSASFRLKDFERARTILQRVIDEYPNSDYVKFATDLLAKINP